MAIDWSRRLQVGIVHATEHPDVTIREGIQVTIRGKCNINIKDNKTQQFMSIIRLTAGSLAPGELAGR